MILIWSETTMQQAGEGGPVLAQETYAAILDSLEKEIICFTDLDHIIRYMNKAAIAHYQGSEALLGTSLLDCHDAESRRSLLELFDRLQAGEDEIIFYQGDDCWVRIRAVRDPQGELIGYYEHYSEAGEGV